MTTNELKLQTPDVVVALDIGTTKVCCLAGRKSAHGKIEMIGVGKVESIGVLRGVVSNLLFAKP
jgi:cell division protein FtsA